jgi:hypothetical protein
MPGISIATGVLLIAYSCYSFAIAEGAPKTALIPAGFGIGFLICGLIGLKEKFLKHAMHLAAVIGLVGFAGGAILGFPNLPDLVMQRIEDPKLLNKARSQNMLALVCLIFVIMCVNSFIQARARRKQQGSPEIPK